MKPFVWGYNKNPFYAIDRLIGGQVIFTNFTTTKLKADIPNLNLHV
jgi:hypothetical protein